MRTLRLSAYGGASPSTRSSRRARADFPLLDMHAQASSLRPSSRACTATSTASASSPRLRVRPPFPPSLSRSSNRETSPLTPLGPSLAATVARVGVDQFVLTPCVLTLFFTAQSLLEGKGFGEAKRRIETSWWPTIQANWGSASLSLYLWLSSFPLVLILGLPRSRRSLDSGSDAQLLGRAAASPPPHRQRASPPSCSLQN